MQFSTTSNHLQIGVVCTCNEHRLLQAKTGDYWRSDKGIRRMLNGLAQDLCYKTVNNSAKMVAPTNGAKWLFWVLAGDDRVCERCISKARGGRGNGYYRVTDFMPRIPVHPNCRCQLEVLFFDPFA